MLPSGGISRFCFLVVAHILISLNCSAYGMTNIENSCQCICTSIGVVKLEHCNKPLHASCMNVPCTYRSLPLISVSRSPGFVCCIKRPHIIKAQSLRPLSSAANKNTGAQQSTVVSSHLKHLNPVAKEITEYPWKLAFAFSTPLISICHSSSDRRLLLLRAPNGISYTFGAASKNDAFRLTACLRGMLRIRDKNVLSAVDELYSRAATNTAFCEPASECATHLSPPYCTCCDEQPSCWLPSLVRLSHFCD